jgi:hypothetical protein
MTNSANAGLNSTVDDLLNMLSVVRSLLAETSRLFSQYDNQPAADSPALQEKTSFPEPELIKDVHSRGRLSMEAAADHFMVFADSTNPVNT